LVKNSAWVRYVNSNIENKLSENILLFVIVYITNILMFSLQSGSAFIAVLAVNTIFTAGWFIIMGTYIYLFLRMYSKQANHFLKNKSPYELDYQRVLRLKQDAIRQLRLLDKKDDKILVNRLMDNIVILDERLSFINSIMEEAKKDIFKKWMMENQFDPKSNSILTMNNLVQDLMENNLHIKTKQL
jgi:hypothetical protein